MGTKVVARSLASMAAVTIVFFVAGREVSATGEGGYESDQGTRIFGTLDPNLEGVFIPFDPSGDPQAQYDSLGIVAGHLVMTRSGETESKAVTVSTPGGGLTLVGTTVGTTKTPSTHVTLVITEARPHQSIYDRPAQQQNLTIVAHADQNHAQTQSDIGDQMPETVWEYHVFVQGATPNGAPLCDPVNNAALVVPAAWKRGQLSTSIKDTGFTFSCVPVLVERTRPQIKLPSADALAKPKAPPVAQPVPPAAGPPQATTNIHLGGTEPKAPPVAQASPPVAYHHQATENIQQGDVINLSASGTMFRLLVEDRVWHGGAAAKCIDRHYAPWAGSVPTPQKLTVTQQTHQSSDARDAMARRFHNVCVQAMTADYAGDGRSYTIPGTVVAILDFADLVKLAKPLPVTKNVDITKDLKLGETVPWYDKLRFEGVWTEDQTGAHAICLSRARWRTLDPDEKYLDAVRNPSPHRRQAGELNSGILANTGLHCDDFTLNELIAWYGDDKPFLFSYSAINERGLYWFPDKNQAGGITTTHVLLKGKVAEIDKKLHSSCATPCRGFYLGNILSPDAPLDEEKFDSKNLIPLYLHGNGNGEYVTTKDLKSPAGYQFISLGDDFLEESPPRNPLQKIWIPHPTGEQPEGYLFMSSHFLDTNSSSDTGARAVSLQLWGIRVSGGSPTRPDGRPSGGSIRM